MMLKMAGKIACYFMTQNNVCFVKCIFLARAAWMAKSHKLVMEHHRLQTADETMVIIVNGY